MNAVAWPSTNRLDPWKTWPVTIRRLRHQSSDVFTIDIEFDEAQVGHSFQFVPGQFNMLYVPGVGEAAISIAGVTPGGLLQHTIRSVGSVTRAIEAGGSGMSLGLRGPYGSSWPVPEKAHFSAGLPAKRDVIIAAGGIGIAPLRSYIKHIAEHRDVYAAVSVLLGARSPNDLLFQDEFVDWRARGIDIQMTVDRAESGWTGQIGVVTLLLDRLTIPDPESTLVLTCGPEVMMRYVAQSATGRGIPEENIWVTLERNMNCAIGLCGHCQLGPAFICREGPVLRYDRVRPWLRVPEL